MLCVLGQAVNRHITMHVAAERVLPMTHQRKYDCIMWIYTLLSAYASMLQLEPSASSKHCILCGATKEVRQCSAICWVAQQVPYR